MGAKYSYNVAFDKDSFTGDVRDLTNVGFEGIWRRFGKPNTIMLLNFKSGKDKRFPFSMDRLLELVPPGADELVFLYPKVIGECSLMFASAGAYSVVSASVDLCNLSDSLKTEVYDNLRVSLRQFHPSVLIAGEELEIDEAIVEMARSRLASSCDNVRLGIEHQHFF